MKSAKDKVPLFASNNDPADAKQRRLRRSQSQPLDHESSGVKNADDHSDAHQQQTLEGNVSIKPASTKNSALAPLSEMRPATLDKIEKAVKQLFAGYDAKGVTMAQIAKTANVSLQTLYKYFGDKHTVFYIIMDRVLARLAVRMMDHLQGIDSVKDRLRKTLWVCFDFVDTHPDSVMVLSSVSSAGIRKIAIYENKELISAFLDVLSDGQKRGVLNDSVPLYVLFDVFMGFVTRIGTMHIVRQSESTLKESFDALFEMLWRSISKPEVAASSDI